MDKSGSQHRPLAGKFQPNQIQASKKVASKIALLAKKIGQKKADSEVACGPKNVYPNLTQAKNTLSDTKPGGEPGNSYKVRPSNTIYLELMEMI